MNALAISRRSLFKRGDLSLRMSAACSRAKEVCSASAKVHTKVANESSAEADALEEQVSWILQLERAYLCI